MGINFLYRYLLVSKKSLVLIILSVFLFSLNQNLISSTPKNQNHFILAKMIGYVRYFHPSDECYKTDWNKLAIYSAKQIDKCRSQKSLIQTLNRIFKPIAPCIWIGDLSDKSDSNWIKNIKNNKITSNSVFWQHQGVSYGMLPGSSEFKSYRINANNLVPKGEILKNHITINHFVNIEKFIGKKLRFTVFAKYLNKNHLGEGDCNLFLVGKFNKTIGLWERVVKTNKWAKYSIEILIDSNAVGINIGSRLSGGGQLYIDNLEVEVKLNNKWQGIFKNSIIEDYNSNASITSHIEKQFTNTNYNVKIDYINKYAGTGCLLIEELNDQYEFIEYDERLFSQIPDRLFFTFVDSINNFKCHIPLVLDRDSLGTIPRANDDEYKQLELRINHKYSNTYVNLGNLYITWNIFHHFYPYFREVNINWDSMLKVNVPKVLNLKNNNNFITILREMCSTLDDSHLTIENKRIDKLYTPEISCVIIDNRLIVKASSSRIKNIKKGDEIIEIDGETVKSLIIKLTNEISAGTESFLKNRIENRILCGTENSKIEIKLGNGIILKENRNRHQKTPVRAIDTTRIRQIKDNILYLKIYDLPLKTIINVIKNCTIETTIICDMRGYPNYHIYSFLNNLVNKVDSSDRFFTPLIIYPFGYDTIFYKTYHGILKPDSIHFTNKFYFLVNAETISAAEGIMSAISELKLGIIIGEQTAGINGNINSFRLEDGYEIVFTGLKATRYDGSRFQGIGIIPSQFIYPTINGIMNNQDDILENTVKIIKNGK